jgi:hypothetical protein
MICFYSKGHAQLVNIESQRIQSDSIRFVLMGEINYATQNLDDHKFSVFNTAITSQIKSKSFKNYFLLIATTEIAKTDQEDLNNAAFFHVRFNKKINNYLKFEALSQFQTNKLMGIDARYLVGFGLRDKLLAKNNLKIYAGSLYIFEIEKTTIEANKASQISRLSFYLSTNFQLPNHIGEFSSVSYYQPNLHQFSDFRLSNQSSLSFRLGPKLAFKNNFNIYYDAFPPPEIAKLNWNFSNGLSITF